MRISDWSSDVCSSDLGQPIVTLIGMDTHGVITGTQVLRHAEPILLLGIPEDDLIHFIAQYTGRFVGDKVHFGGSRDADSAGLDAISGATVTVIAENQVILRSAMKIARQVGIVKPVLRPQVAFTAPSESADWNTLVADGSIQHLTVRAREVGKPPTRQQFIDLYFGYLNAPGIGTAVLGDAGYRRLMRDLRANEHALFVVSNGTESFKEIGRAHV